MTPYNDEYKKDLAVKHKLHEARMTKVEEHDDLLDDEDFEVKRFLRRRKAVMTS